MKHIPKARCLSDVCLMNTENSGLLLTEVSVILRSLVFVLEIVLEVL